MRVIITIGRNGFSPEKLAKITNAQFLDLSTDIFDDIKRRGHLGHPNPTLLSNAVYSQKRIQAREKLSMLNEDKFLEIIKDVVSEWSRRFPEHIVSTQGDAKVSFQKRKAPRVNTSGLSEHMKQLEQEEQHDGKSVRRFSFFNKKIEKLFAFGV